MSDICICGHPKSEHFNAVDSCVHRLTRDFGCGSVLCPCGKYQESPPPASEAQGPEKEEANPGGFKSIDPDATREAKNRVVAKRQHRIDLFERFAVAMLANEAVYGGGGNVPILFEWAAELAEAAMKKESEF